VQKPHPPIIVGGDGENTIKCVVSDGDGSMPVGRRRDTAPVLIVRQEETRPGKARQVLAEGVESSQFPEGNQGRRLPFANDRI
jgi:hypothetical protein